MGKLAKGGTLEKVTRVKNLRRAMIDHVLKERATQENQLTIFNLIFSIVALCQTKLIKHTRVYLHCDSNKGGEKVSDVVRTSLHQWLVEAGDL